MTAEIQGKADSNFQTTLTTKEQVDRESREIKKLASKKEFNAVGNLIFNIQKDATDGRLNIPKQLQNLKQLRGILKSYLEKNDPQKLEELRKNLKIQSEKLKLTINNVETPKQEESFDRLWHKLSEKQQKNNNEAIKFIHEILYRGSRDYQALYDRKGDNSNILPPIRLSGEQLSVFKNSLENLQKLEVLEKGIFKLSGVQYLRNEKYGVLVAKLETKKNGKTIISLLSPPIILHSGKLRAAKNSKYPKPKFINNAQIDSPKLVTLLQKDRSLSLLNLAKSKVGKEKKLTLTKPELSKEFRAFQKTVFENRLIRFQEALKANPDLAVSSHLKIYESMLKIQRLDAIAKFNEWNNKFSTTNSISASVKSIMALSVEAKKINPKMYESWQLTIKDLQIKIKLVQSFSNSWEKAKTNERDRRQVLAHMLLEGGPFKEMALRRLISMSNEQQKQNYKMSAKEISNMETRGELLLRRKLTEEVIHGKQTVTPIEAQKTFLWIKEASGKFCNHSVYLEGEKHSIFHQKNRSSLTLKILNQLAGEVPDKKSLLITSPEDFKKLIPQIKKAALTNKFLRSLIGPDDKKLNAELLRITKIGAQLMFSKDPNERSIHFEMKKIGELKQALIKKLKIQEPAWFTKFGKGAVEWIDNPVNAVGLLSCAVGGGLANGAIRGLLRSGRLFKGVRGADLTIKSLSGYKSAIAQVGELLVSNAFATTATYAMKLGTGQIAKNDSFMRDLFWGMTGEGILKVRVLTKFINQGDLSKKIAGEAVNAVVNAGGLVGSEYLKYAAENSKFANWNEMAQVCIQALTSKAAIAAGKHLGNRAEFMAILAEKGPSKAGGEVFDRINRQVLALNQKISGLSAVVKKGIKNTVEAINVFKQMAVLAKTLNQTTRQIAKLRSSFRGRV